MGSKIFWIEDLTCEKCVLRIRTVLEKIGKNVIIVPYYEENKAKVIMNTDASNEEISEALKEASKNTKHNYRAYFLDDFYLGCC